MDKKMTVDIYRKTKGGVLPNPVFHRPLDNLHSRCIEYPLVASKIPSGSIKILDVGSAKSDEMWISWLASSYENKVYAVDYDSPEIRIPRNVTFTKADIRNLPYLDSAFDVVTAVSVLEHIGLSNPQVTRKLLPPIDKNGDMQAFEELVRVLRPGGKLIMTFPFGRKEELILSNEARCYNARSLGRFKRLAKNVDIDCYEYQFEDLPEYCSYPPSYIEGIVGRFFDSSEGSRTRYFTRGTTVTWRKINPANIKAENKWHVDGILCTVWEK